jgi:hypothetical protein
MIMARQTETYEINSAPFHGRRSVPFSKVLDFIENCIHTHLRQVADVVRG